MNRIEAVLLAVLLSPGLLVAQSPTSSVDITSLQRQLAAQQKLLDQQQQQIQALQAALAEQQKMLQSVMQGSANPSAEALQKSVQDLKQEVTAVEAQTTEPPPFSPEAEKKRKSCSAAPRSRT